MKHSLETRLNVNSGKNKQTRATVSVLICLIILVCSTGCRTGNDKTASTFTSEGKSYSAVTLDSYQTSDKEVCRFVSAASGYDMAAILVSVYTLPLSKDSTGEFALMYDSKGILTSQIALHDVIDSDKSIVSLAIGSTGNLCVFARSQDDNKVVHSYLYSFDSAGKLQGEPMELSFDESFLPMNFIIGSDGHIYFGALSSSSGMTMEREIDVFDSKGNLLYNISNEGLTGNLYQTGDLIFASSRETGVNAGYTSQLFPVDTANRKLKEAIDISDITSSGGAICAGDDGFYLSKSDGIYSIDLVTQESKAILLWNDMKTDTAGSDAARIPVIFSSGKIFVLTFPESKSGETGSFSVSLLTRIS